MAHVVRDVELYSAAAARESFKPLMARSTPEPAIILACWPSVKFCRAEVSTNTSFTNSTVKRHEQGRDEQGYDKGEAPLAFQFPIHSFVVVEKFTVFSPSLTMRVTRTALGRVLFSTVSQVLTHSLPS